MLCVVLVIDFITNLTPRQMALGLVAFSALLLIVEDRRFALISLLVQYLLLALLVAAQVYPSLVLVRAGLGLVVCLILLITALHAHQAAPWAPPALDLSATPLSGEGPGLASGGALVRLSVALLGSVIAYGLWQTYPIAGMLPEVNLVGYWLVTVGLLMTVTTSDPMRMGFGIITFVNGFEGMYLTLERSLLVIGLLSFVDILLALAISLCTEAWLASLEREAVRC